MPAYSDARVSRDDDVGVSRTGVRHVPAAGELTDAASDDVFSVDVDDDPRQRRLLHAWAQYRIAQRGIMVSTVHCFYYSLSF